MMNPALIFLLPLLFSSCLQHSHGTREIIDLLSKTLPNAPILQELASEWSNFTLHHASPQDGAMEADKIEILPGQPKVDFNQYSGYVTVDPTMGKSLFYYFVEATDDPSSKPLLLWLSGGPGCSSLGSGAMISLGPFRPQSDNKTLHINPYAWNNVANVLFLESPVGVGFSYANDPFEYNLNGDTTTVQDNYVFLINWLERFPQYKTRDFFITGESYAGHYVPELAATILAFNKLAPNPIKLKGIAIGNPIFNWRSIRLASYKFLRNHSIISNDVYHGLTKICKWIPASNNLDDDPTGGAGCFAAYNAYETAINEVDQYNIKAPVCGDQVPKSRAPEVVDPCISDYTEGYINLREVQTALHAIAPGGALVKWRRCSYNVVRMNWQQAPATMLPIVKQVVDGQIRVWVYSGVLDSAAPTAATKSFLNKLHLPCASPSRSWYADGQVAGDVIAYEGLTFATVADAGHRVPQDQPKSALALISAFLGGNSLPCAK